LRPHGAVGEDIDKGGKRRETVIQDTTESNLAPTQANTRSGEPNDEQPKHLSPTKPKRHLKTGLEEGKSLRGDTPLGESDGRGGDNGASLALGVVAAEAGHDAELLAGRDLHDGNAVLGAEGLDELGVRSVVAVLGEEAENSLLAVKGLNDLAETADDTVNGGGGGDDLLASLHGGKGDGHGGLDSDSDGGGLGHDELLTERSLESRKEENILVEKCENGENTNKTAVSDDCPKSVDLTLQNN
jgi:hypothetical protein